MSFIPDSGWLQALKLPLRILLGIAIACVVLLVLDHKTLLDLGAFGTLTKPLVIVALVFTAALSVTGIGGLIYEFVTDGRKNTALQAERIAREKELREQSELERAAVLERLNHLAPRELRYLADALREGSQSFYTYVHSPPVTTLMGKGLVYTPGGTHHQDHYPFTIHDFVWKALLQRKAELIARDDANQKREDEERRRGRR